MGKSDYWDKHPELVTTLEGEYKSEKAKAKQIRHAARKAAKRADEVLHKRRELSGQV